MILIAYYFYQGLHDARAGVTLATTLLLLPFVLLHIRQSKALMFLLFAILLNLGVGILDRAVEGDSNGPGAFSLPGWVHLLSPCLDYCFVVVILALATLAAVRPLIGRREAVLLHATLILAVGMPIAVTFTAYWRAAEPRIDFKAFDPKKDVKPDFSATSQVTVGLTVKEAAVAGQMPLFEITLHNASSTPIAITDDAERGRGLTRDIRFQCFDSEGRSVINFSTVWNTVFPAETLAPGDTRKFDFPKYRQISGMYAIMSPQLKKPGRYVGCVRFTFFEKPGWQERAISGPVYFDLPGR